MTCVAILMRVYYPHPVQISVVFAKIRLIICDKIESKIFHILRNQDEDGVTLAGVRKFSGDGKLPSQDCIHLTQNIAKFHAKRVNAEKQVNNG